MRVSAMRFTRKSAAIGIGAAMALAGGAYAPSMASGAPLQGAPPGRSAEPIYLNPSYSPAERASDLVSRMTLAEKAKQMDSSRAPALKRLGIAAWGWWNESNHGVNASTLTETGNATNLTNTTSYPSDLSMGSTWNPNLVYDEASLIGDEARDTAPNNTQNLDFYAPTVNLTRDPRWGRNDESWSEDPTLTANLASQYVNGLQGQNQDGQLPPSANGYYKAIATLKHYAANNSEVNRRDGSSDMDQRTLLEYYTAQFAGIIRQSHPGSIMSSYNSINGTPTAASVELMDTQARQTYGFNGYFTSDCDAIREIQAGHHWQPPEASAPLDQYGRTAFANSAGEDLDCNAGYHDQYSYGNTIPTAIAQHIKTQTDTYNVGDVDTSLTRLFTARIETGEFDSEGQVPWVRAARKRLGGVTWVNSDANKASTETPKRLDQAQASAEQSLVLLKNKAVDGKSMLPLKVPHSGDYKVAVIGAYAHPSAFLYLGGYSSIQQSAGSANNVDAYSGIKSAVEGIDPDAKVDFYPGVTGGAFGSQLNTVDPASIAAASKYDAVIVVAGTDFTTAREDQDRKDLSLPGAQASMIKQVEAANPHTIVYLETVGGVDTTSFQADTPALLWSSYNGQRQGTALANVLLGKVNPSGHLPFTWYADDSQLPPITDYTLRPTATNPGRTYMYFNGDSAWPFGYGQSYTDFSYSNLRVQQRSVDANGTLRVTADVTNRGSVTGSAVPQLYVTTPFEPASAERPKKRLEAFDKVTVSPGQTKKVTFTVQASKLAFYDETAKKFVVDNGEYGIELGTSSADSDIVARGKVSVHGSLGETPSVVTAKPIESGDVSADVAQRVRFDVGTAVDPQLTVSMNDGSVHGYVTKGQSSPLPRQLKIRYTSNRSDVVRVDHGRLRTVGSGVATVTASVSYRGHHVSTSFVVNVAPLAITSDPEASFTVGAQSSYGITTSTTQSPTSSEIPQISENGALPAGLTFKDNGDGTATITGTPAAGSEGSYSITIRARNHTSPESTQHLTVTVS